ncbi:chromosome transmission fidelity protein 8 homolog [Ceratina calcarata]|uniref:Chromosome transmission fidelity protein 8 homolog n=1 Tax=Ceratina calcarata TaxID=156304 RepID=A0AAJ7J1I7_9HYME|nr:chromosome transmission fidelity protein 8 homolog [Ceratina calcarata]
MTLNTGHYARACTGLRSRASLSDVISACLLVLIYTYSDQLCLVYPPKLRMIIRIKRVGELEEWVIIELQGDLKFTSGDNTNKYIGDLHFTKSGAPVFIVGAHLLHGKEALLPKPFAVLIKKSNKDSSMENNSETNTEYVVKAIVKKKLIFKSRPKYITNSSK